MRVIIVDDEKLARDAIIEIGTRRIPDFEVVAEAASIAEAKQAILKYQPDLLLLDIQLLDGSGFDLLDQFSLPLNFKVIFITAYEEYAIKAFKASVLDYLLKPIDADEFVTSINRAKFQLNLENFNKNLQTFIHLYHGYNSEQKQAIVIHSRSSLICLNHDEILRIEGEGNHANIFLLSGELIRVSRTFNSFEEELKGKGFLQSHKSHLVNIRYIKTFHSSELSLLMIDGTRVPVAFRRRSQVSYSIANWFK